MSNTRLATAFVFYCFITRGKQVATGLDISLAVSTVQRSPWTQQNTGWNYGLNAAALAGLADTAANLLLQRAVTPPAAGYRWPGFAPHEQDFDPSSDHFANMNRCLQVLWLLRWDACCMRDTHARRQDMLLQSGDDGFDNTTIVHAPRLAPLYFCNILKHVLLPAWPCGWDVQFKLWAPLNSSVEVVYSGGVVQSLRVEVSGWGGDGCVGCGVMVAQPQERLSSVKWGGCVH